MRSQYSKYKFAATINSLVNLTAMVKLLRPRTLTKPPTLLNKVLLVCLDYLGDAVMATPVPQALKSSFTEVKVTVLTRPQNTAVFVNNPYVDEIMTDHAPWWSSKSVTGSLYPSYLSSLLKNITRIHRAKYDVIIDLRGDLRHIIFFGAFTRPKILLSYGRTGGEIFLSAHIPYEQQMNEVDKKLALLSPLGINAKREDPRIWLFTEELEKAQRLIKNYFGKSDQPVILIDPGAKPIQQWPIERFAHVARTLWRRFHNPVLVSAGPDYTKLARRLVNLVGSDTSRLIKSEGIRALAAVVACCDLVISSDTGITHIASAVGTQTVTLYGPTNPSRFWHGVKDAQIVQVREPCTSELHERCQMPGHSLQGSCMLEISEEMVEKAVFNALSKYPPVVSRYSTVASGGLL